MVGNWKRRDGTPDVHLSDGYATGLATLALLRADRADEVRLQRALDWLREHQSRWNGSWNGYSLNVRRRNPFRETTGFMDDAATAFASLALAEAAPTPWSRR